LLDGGEGSEGVSSSLLLLRLRLRVSGEAKQDPAATAADTELARHIGASRGEAGEQGLMGRALRARGGAPPREAPSRKSPLLSSIAFSTIERLARGRGVRGHLRSLSERSKKKKH